MGFSTFRCQFCRDKPVTHRHTQSTQVVKVSTFVFVSAVPVLWGTRGQSMCGEWSSPHRHQWRTTGLYQEENVQSVLTFSYSRRSGLSCPNNDWPLTLYSSWRPCSWTTTVRRLTPESTSSAAVALTPFLQTWESSTPGSSSRVGTVSVWVSMWTTSTLMWSVLMSVSL